MHFDKQKKGNGFYPLSTEPCKYCYITQMLLLSYVPATLQAQFYVSKFFSIIVIFSLHAVLLPIFPAFTFRVLKGKSNILLGKSKNESFSLVPRIRVSFVLAPPSVCSHNCLGKDTKMLNLKMVANLILHRLPAS